MEVTFFSESPGSACHKYRVLHPVSTLNRSKNITAFYSTKWDSSVKDSDIFVFQRNSNHGAAELLLALAREKKSVVYDVDDDIFQIPETNPVFPLYYNIRPEQTDVAILGRQVLGIRFATAVTVSSHRLMEVYSAINPNVRLLPNCVDINEWKTWDPILVSKPDVVRIFWGGSPTHQQDLKIVGEVFPALYQRFGEKIEIVIMGDDSIKFGCPILKIPFGSYNFFQRIMMSCQIGVAPMVDDLFNRAKSDLRIKEMACARLAIAASPVGEYKLDVDILCPCKTTSDWIEALSMLIQDVDKRNQYSSKAYDWVETWDIRHHIGKWEKLFEEIYDNDRRGSGQVVSVQSAKYTSHVFDGSKVRVGQ